MTALALEVPRAPDMSTAQPCPTAGAAPVVVTAIAEELPLRDCVTCRELADLARSWGAPVYAPRRANLRVTTAGGEIRRLCTPHSAALLRQAVRRRADRRWP